LSGNQTISTGVDTLINLDTEVFDTANSFDTSTHKFTPLVAGKYFVSASAICNGSSTGCSTEVWKNGALYSKATTNASGVAIVSSILIDMNGTTDYLQLYANQHAGTVIDSATWGTYLSATWVSSETAAAAGGASTSTTATSSSLEQQQQNLGWAFALFIAGFCTVLWVTQDRRARL